MLYYIGRWQFKKRREERETAHFIREVQLGNHHGSMQNVVNGDTPRQGSMSSMTRHRQSVPPSMRLSGSRLSTPPATVSNKKKPHRDGAVAVAIMDSSDDESAEVLSDCGNTDDCLSDSEDNNTRSTAGGTKKRVRFHHKKNSTQFIEIGDIDDDEEMDSKFKANDGGVLETVADGDALGTTNIMAGLVENSSPR